jgi:hypothetical protein
MPHRLVLFKPSFVFKLMHAEDNVEIASESDCSFLLLLIFSMSFLKNIKQDTPLQIRHTIEIN